MKKPRFSLHAWLYSLTLVLLICPSPATPQEGDPDLDRAAAGWDDVFRQIEMPEINPGSSFTAYCADRLIREQGLQPGDSAMVLAMGDGRNALYLADLGLAVTGVDFSAVENTFINYVADLSFAPIRGIDIATFASLPSTNVTRAFFQPGRRPW